MNNSNDNIELLDSTKEIKADEILEETTQDEEITFEEQITEISSSDADNENINNSVIEIAPIEAYSKEDSFNNDSSVEENNKNNKITPRINKRYLSFEERLAKIIISLVVLLIFIIVSTMAYNLLKNENNIYVENSIANYQVCLKDNQYYNEQCLNEDMEYITELTKNINVEFNYNAVFQKEFENKYTYYIKGEAVVKTEEGKKLYSKEEKLTEEEKYFLTKNVTSFSEKIEIPFEKVNKHITNYLNSFSLLTDANYKVSFVINDGLNEKEVASLLIPLNKQTFSIEKEVLSNQNSIFTTPSNKVIQIIYTIVIILLFILFLLNIKKLYKITKGFLNKSSKYEKKLKEILTNYDRVIITGKDNNIISKKENIYEVKTFFELLDVRDTIDKPILYYKINNVKSEFYVQDIGTTYKYTLKESDIK